MRALLILTTMIALIACGGVLDNRPSAAEDYLRTLIAEQSKDKIELVSFEKLDGVERDLGGAETYVLEFRAIVQVKELLYKSCSGSGCSCWESFHVEHRQKIYSDWEMCDRKKLLTNSKVELIGAMTMLKSDNGWRVEQLKITDYKSIGGTEFDSAYSEFIGEYYAEGADLIIKQSGAAFEITVSEYSAGKPAFKLDGEPIDGKIRFNTGKGFGFISWTNESKEAIEYDGWVYVKN